jgi:uncharacterized phage protein (TIGR02218 family)
MKNASPELLALLATRQFWVADLYQIDLVGGGTLRYCSGDQDIVWNGFTWSSGGTTGLYFDRQGSKAKVVQQLGVSVDTLVFDIIPGEGTVLGADFMESIQNGLFDGSDLTLYRAFMPTYGNTSAGTLIWFVGRTADITFVSSFATFNVNSHLELLNISMPRNLFQAGCVNTLYDASCGLAQGDFEVSDAAGVGTQAGTIYTTLTEATGWFNQGKIQFTSGPCDGLWRTVKAYVNSGTSIVTLTSPFPVSPEVGDTFLIYPGCDKTQSTCETKFSNLDNFRGFPYIPVAETAV